MHGWGCTCSHSFWNRLKREQNGNPERRTQVSYGEGCSVGRWELPAEMRDLGASLDTCRHIYCPLCFPPLLASPLLEAGKEGEAGPAGEENLEDRVLG